jgi:hypothetical protein
LIIIAGRITVDPNDRERYLSAADHVAVQARHAPGVAKYRISSVEPPKTFPGPSLPITTE